MENSDKTAECLEIAAVKLRNHTLVADDIHWCVCQIQCLCQWQFLNYYPMIWNCYNECVARQISHPVEVDSLSSVKIH